MKYHQGNQNTENEIVSKLYELLDLQKNYL
jgi:hypothetical protein